MEHHSSVQVQGLIHLQLGTSRGAAPTQSAEDAPGITFPSSLLQPKSSWVSLHQQNQQPSGAVLEVFCLMSTRPPTALRLSAPAPRSQGTVGQPQPEAELQRGSWGSKDREEKGIERQRFVC